MNLVIWYCGGGRDEKGGGGVAAEVTEVLDTLGDGLLGGGYVWSEGTATKGRGGLAHTGRFVPAPSVGCGQTPERQLNSSEPDSA